MGDSPIVIENLVKYFAGRCVLDGISLEVPRGCIYGLLGRNGSGKTTIIRILLGLEPTTRGRTALLGQDSTKLSAQTHGRIGYVAEGHNLIQNYKVRRLVSLCKGLSLHWNEEFFSHLMETFRLPMDRKVKELSAGMRAELNLALAMAVDPELLILDDPTLGLDTVARRQFLELAIDLIQKQNRTILFSSHILSDVERIAEREAKRRETRLLRQRLRQLLLHGGKLALGGADLVTTFRWQDDPRTILRLLTEPHHIPGELGHRLHQERIKDEIDKCRSDDRYEDRQAQDAEAIADHRLLERPLLHHHVDGRTLVEARLADDADDIVVRGEIDHERVGDKGGPRGVAQVV